MNRPIVVSEKAERKKHNGVRKIFSTRFRPDRCVKIQVTSAEVLGGVGACNVWPVGWIVYSEIQQSFKGRW